MLFDDTYQTISTSSRGIYKEKGSKFIAHAFPVFSEDLVKEKLSALRKEYHDARHHCYAYCLGPDRSAWRINDDGEPSGTAGKPIHGQILSKDLTNVLIVVIRYFGGIKLGVPGLINAYRTAAKDALENAEIVTRMVEEVYETSFGYPAMNDVMRILKEENAAIMEQEFENACRIRFSIRRSSGTKIVSRLQKIQGITTSFYELKKELLT
ncbi:MAG: YigZ family protein [Bacteroidetes bacterium]|nr:YigZ family protein [Bacteroidota bacterium]